MKWTTLFRSSKLTLCLILLGLVGGLLWTVPAQAYDLPGVNLGFTSFVDGGPPAGPGFYFQTYLTRFTSDEFKDSDGDSLLPSFANEDIDLTILLLQGIYQSDTEIPLIKGKWGLDVILPIVYTDISYGTDNPAFPQDNAGGFGDLLVGPFIQWDPIMGKSGPIMLNRIEFQLIFPTGKYDSDRELNPGSNFFSFNPYWSTTLFLMPKWTLSWRLHYLWNDENDDPNRNFVGADDTQAGQAIHVNFASAYEVLEKTIRVGVNGYYLKQITNTEADGRDVRNSKEQVLAIGPGAVYHFSQNNHIFLNAYFETMVENRPEGYRLNLRWTHHF
jgi:anthranilate 1,2-dioxygenase (deaminating, decarboxylating) large subunit